jgi:hypothetical protein
MPIHVTIFEVREGIPLQVGIVLVLLDMTGVNSRVSGTHDWIQSTITKLDQGDTSIIIPPV